MSCFRVQFTNFFLVPRLVLLNFITILYYELCKILLIALQLDVLLYNRRELSLQNKYPESPTVNSHFENRQRFVCFCILPLQLNVLIDLNSK